MKAVSFTLNNKDYNFEVVNTNNKQNLKEILEIINEYDFCSFKRNFDNLYESSNNHKKRNLYRILIISKEFFNIKTKYKLNYEKTNNKILNQLDKISRINSKYFNHNLASLICIWCYYKNEYNKIEFNNELSNLNIKNMTTEMPILSSILKNKFNDIIEKRNIKNKQFILKKQQEELKIEEEKYRNEFKERIVSYKQNFNKIKHNCYDLCNDELKKLIKYIDENTDLLFGSYVINSLNKYYKIDKYKTYDWFIIEDILDLFTDFYSYCIIQYDYNDEKFVDEIQNNKYIKRMEIEYIIKMDLKFRNKTDYDNFYSLFE